LNANIITVDKGASAEAIKDGFKLNEEGIFLWLVSKCILDAAEVLLAYKDLGAWMRTGGETYSSSFEFATEKYTKRIFLKALVTMSPEKGLSDWKRRRKILFENGIPVSNWYSAFDAIIFEDFYPKQCIGNIDFNTLLSIAYKLDKLGFATLKFTDDIRSDSNNNPFFIDFGFDLGEPGDTMQTAAKEHLIRQYPQEQTRINIFYNEQELK
jgi:hypothetical protein